MGVDMILDFNAGWELMVGMEMAGRGDDRWDGSGMGDVASKPRDLRNDRGYRVVVVVM